MGVFILTPRCLASIFAISALTLATILSAQSYPNKPIRIVIGPAGGGVDFSARLIAPGLSSGLGQQVIVENRAAVLAIETVAQAPPDGYTLLFYGSALWLGPLLRDKASYDPISDFSPVSLVVRSPNVLVAHPSVPVKSVEDLIALAKARPGQLNYASAGIGGSGHIAMELFKALTGANIVHVPYKGTGPALNDLIGGQVQLMVATTPSASPYVKAGRLRALAVTSAEPSALVPGLPTVAASGLPGYESVSITGIFAPARTPEAIISRQNQEIVRVVRQPDVKEKLFHAGLEAVGSSPRELAATTKSEMARFGKVIKDAGIRQE